MDKRWMLLGLVGACERNVGDESLVGCLDDEVVVIEDADAPVEGFASTPAEAAAALAGTFEGTLALADDSEQAGTLTVDAFVFTEVARRSWRSDGGEELALAGQDCPDVYRASDVGLGLASTPELDEAWDATLTWDTEDHGAFAGDLDLADLVGSAAPFGFDPAAMDAVSLQVSGGWSGDVWTVDLAFQGEVVEDDGPDGTASATLDPWGTLTAPDDIVEE